MSGIGNDRARLRSDYVPPIGHIEEVIINILSRLPVKTVVACKCVAKDWLRLISEPRFPLMQLSWSRKKPKYIFCPYPDYCDKVYGLCLMEENGLVNEDVPLVGFEEVSSPEIMCFLNGLACSVSEGCLSFNDIDINIFNPITHDSILLPRGSPSLRRLSVAVAFDPKSNDFKAFRFFSNSSKGEVVKYSCEVYTSGSTAWRRISEDVKPPRSNPFHPYCPYYASVAGAVYWFEWLRHKRGTPFRILSVDMNDSFTKINLPNQLNEDSFLIELEGCLSVVNLTDPELHGPSQNEDPQSYIEVYKFENSRWHMRSKVVIDLINVQSVNSIAARGSEIFLIVKHADESNGFLVFDFVEESFTTLDLDEEFEGRSPVAFPFVESLLKCSGT